MYALFYLVGHGQKQGHPKTLPLAAAENTQLCVPTLPWNPSSARASLGA